MLPPACSARSTRAKAPTSTGLRGSRKKRPTLSLAALARLEGEIGARLHDDILVLLALRDPVAELLTGIRDVNSIADAADEHAAPEGWVCISVVYSDPVGELVAEAHGGPYLYLAAEIDPQGADARVLVGSDGLHGDEEAEPRGAVIERMLYEARTGEHRDAIAVGQASDEPLDPQPLLVPGRQLLSDSARGGRVMHPKFGMGEVIERSGEGEQEKVVVRFADKKRTLLARFVEPCDE